MSSNNCSLGTSGLDDQLVLFQKALSILKRREREEIEKERAKQRLRQQLFTLDNSRCSLLENSSWTQCISIQCRLQFYSILLSWLRLPFIAPSQVSVFSEHFLEGPLSQKRNPDAEVIVDTFEASYEVYLGESFDHSITQERSSQFGKALHALSASRYHSSFSLLACVT